MEINPNFSERSKDDFQLVQSAINGTNPRAFERLLIKYKDSVYYLILKMVNNREDSEDLTMEVFEKIFTNISHYNSQWAFSTWLYKSATNHAIDFLRKKRLETTSIDESRTNEKGDKLDRSFKIASEAMTPEEVLIKQQRVEHMQETLSKLAPKYKQLIEMRYFQELSYEEIAEQLNIPLGTVKAQLFRAKDFLLALYKKNPNG
jgi:RNA polymerase sigma-70 factor (ECF subfamily)